ncbi:SMI1/KNR4 family protein [Myceligenerans indicum]|uniref:SMI1/KNR4 family protein n=1 Tax=Myceligenerans indicum TaxID=2593663 RepID=A0ABS1LJF6_9MICO|nr:SMI1/KNR4 family protein [Myceligenerans indicum]MBL0886364.1 SMI1/KNR4 family protein [Myceligenerans indicum]
MPAVTLDELLATPGLVVGHPADPAAIRACETALGHPLPGDLAKALLRADGITRDHENLLWAVDDIARTNTEFRDGTFGDLYMSFDDAVFFGDPADGDQFFIATTGTQDVYQWDHETDSRTWVASSVTDYLERCMAPIESSTGESLGPPAIGAEAQPPRANARLSSSTDTTASTSTTSGEPKVMYSVPKSSS